MPCFSLSGGRDYCPPQRLSRRSRAGCIATTATARSPTSPRAAGIGARVRPGARRRRPPTSTATAGSTSTSPTTARRTSSGSTSATARSGTRRCCRARRERRRRSRRRAWASTPATSTTTATKTCSSPTDRPGHDLYVNDGIGHLRGPERARPALGAASLPYTGFGTAWFDFDNDGWLDLLTVNGAVPDDRGAGAARTIRFRCSSASSCSAISATAGSRTSPARPARRSSWRRSAAAPRSATSTTTATPTWSSATTAGRRAC